MLVFYQRSHATPSERRARARPVQTRMTLTIMIDMLRDGGSKVLLALILQLNVVRMEGALLTIARCCLRRG